MRPLGPKRERVEEADGEILSLNEGLAKRPQELLKILASTPLESVRYAAPSFQSDTCDGGWGGWVLVSGGTGRYQILRKMLFFRRDFPDSKLFNNSADFRNSRLDFGSS